MAKPRGLPFGSVSGIWGRPVELLKRTVIEVLTESKWGASERSLAAEEGSNVPRMRIPRA